MIPKLVSYKTPATVDEIPKNKVSWKVDPSRAALLIHDMQDYFLDFWGEDSEIVQNLVQNIKQLRAVCKAQGIPVYYTAQPINQKPEDRALLNDMWGPGIDNCPERQRIHSELEPEDDDHQLVKWRYSAFVRSSLEKSLKEQNRDQLIICGVYAHIGCLATAMDAFMSDIQPFLVADALADFSRENHDNALSTAARCCGRVELLHDMMQELVEYDLHSTVSASLEDGEEWPEDDENLIDYGLDSVQIMKLVSRWRRVYPAIDFVKLAQNPTIQSWRLLLA